MRKYAAAFLFLFGGLASAATTTLTAFPSANRQAGAYSFGPSSVPLGVSQATIKALRDGWPAVEGDLVLLAVDISFDAGNTWQLLGAFGAPGGQVIAPGGAIEQYSSISVTLPQPFNSARRVRAYLTLGAQLKTTVTIEVSQ